MLLTFSVEEDSPARLTLLEARAAVVEELLELLELLRTALLEEALAELLELLELRTAVPEVALLELLEELRTALPEVALPELLELRVAVPEEEERVALPEELELLRETWLEEPDRLDWLLEELERVALLELELRVLWLEELDRVVWLLEEERVALPEVERVWATISGAATRDRAISTDAAIVIIRLIASKILMI